MLLFFSRVFTQWHRRVTKLFSLFLFSCCRFFMRLVTRFVIISSSSCITALFLRTPSFSSLSWCSGQEMSKICCKFAFLSSFSLFWLFFFIDLLFLFTNKTHVFVYCFLFIFLFSYKRNNNRKHCKLVFLTLKSMVQLWTIKTQCFLFVFLLFFYWYFLSNQNRIQKTKSTTQQIYCSDLESYFLTLKNSKLRKLIVRKIIEIINRKIILSQLIRWN